MTSSTGLHPYVEFLFDIDPILASEQGDDRGNDRLGDITPEAIAEHDARRRAFLAAAEGLTTPPAGSRAQLEHSLLLTELRTAVRRAETDQVWRRAPYWYTERLGQALSVLMTPDQSNADPLLGRLQAIPGYLQQAERNLSIDSPALWAAMGVTASRGLQRFLTHAVPGYADGLPTSLATDVRRLAAAAAEAAAGYSTFVETLVPRATGRWAAGTEYVDFLLSDYHHLDLDADGLAEHGRELVDRDRRELVSFAATIDPDTGWQQQLDRIKDDHPRPADFLRTYEAAMSSALRHTREHDLVAVPDGAVCEMDWVPEFRRAGLPLGVMAPSPPYAAGLRSGFLITPADPEAAPQRVREHMRDNCFVFATSIAGHETYPGHHVQYVHHKLGTARDSIGRYFTIPQFVEGWGLYVEDLLEETGFMADDRVRLFKRRNSLWRALRVVVDVGLHTGTLTIESATELMQQQAGMERHMAAGEVQRYARHDNPTYPSSYALGRDLLHRTREQYARRTGSSFSLREFHDRVLSFGSPPLALLPPDLETADRGVRASP